MARTINDIFSQLSEAKIRIQALHLAITDDVAVQADLADLNSPSKTSIWRLWAFVIAVCMWIQEKQFEQHKAEVDALAATTWHGSVSWWIRKAKEFQLGDVLQVVYEVPQYPVKVDAADPKRIVSFAAITETSFGGALLKVAKASADTYTALTQVEKDAFSNYVKQLQPPGSRITVLSEEPDQVRVFATVYYNPQYDLTAIKQQVEAAIQEYRKQLTETGEIVQSKVQDVMQAISGVIDVEMNRIEARSAGGSFSTVQRKYQTFAGYAVIDPGQPLSTTISYTPES